MNKFKFSDFGIKAETSSLQGEKIKINQVLNSEILIEKYEVKPSIYKDGQDCLYLQLIKNNERRVLFIGSKMLINMIRQVEESNFPFTTTIVIENNSPKFT